MPNEEVQGLSRCHGHGSAHSPATRRSSYLSLTAEALLILTLPFHFEISRFLATQSQINPPEFSSGPCRRYIAAPADPPHVEQPHAPRQGGLGPRRLPHGRMSSPNKHFWQFYVMHNGENHEKWSYTCVYIYMYNIYYVYIYICMIYMYVYVCICIYAIWNGYESQIVIYHKILMSPVFTCPTHCPPAPLCLLQLTLAAAEHFFQSRLFEMILSWDDLQNSAPLRPQHLKGSVYNICTYVIKL